MKTQISPRDWEALSAYLDGQLAPKERQQLEARLQTRSELHSALDELRRTRAVVRAHLPMRAPRNFTLTPDMAGLRDRSQPPAGWFTSLRLASALSSLLFIFIVLGDVLLGDRLSPAVLVAERQRSSEPAAVESAPLLPPAAVSQAPVQEAQPTPMAAAQAPAAPNPTVETMLEAPPAAPVTDTYQLYEKGVGAGGGGPGETEDQTALSQMAPSATATPLPTPTVTSSVTPEALPTLEGVAPSSPETGNITWLPSRPVWRWLEVILAVLGVASGLVAFYLSRIGRA